MQYVKNTKRFETTLGKKTNKLGVGVCISHPSYKGGINKTVIQACQGKNMRHYPKNN
jgi:hypothetical protein